MVICLKMGQTGSLGHHEVKFCVIKGFSTQLQASKQLFLGILKAVRISFTIFVITRCWIGSWQPQWSCFCLFMFHVVHAILVYLGCVHFWSASTHSSLSHCFLWGKIRLQTVALWGSHTQQVMGYAWNCSLTVWGIIAEPEYLGLGSQNVSTAVKREGC